MAALSSRDGADCVVCTRFFFSFVTCWRIPTSALLIIIVSDLRKAVDGRKKFTPFLAICFIEELRRTVEQKTETYEVKLIPGQQINAQESLSLWGYEDIVMGPLYALSLGDLDPDIAGPLQLFSTFIPAEVIRLVWLC